ncbi:MAG: response regulator [Chloroflexi bacterium]|nr:response regulator [Chloroflexota bacterium]
MIDISDLQTKNSAEEQNVNFWQMFHAVTVAIQKAAHSETTVYQAYSEQIKRLGLYSSISWVDETETFLEVASIVPPRGVEFLLAKRPMIGARFPLNKIPVTRSVIESGRTIYEADIVTLLFDGRLNPLIKLWPTAPRFLPHIPVIIAPLYRDGRTQGVLYLAGKTISPGDLDAVTALAHHLSIALDNARLFKALQTDIAERQQSETVTTQAVTLTPEKLEEWPDVGQQLTPGPYVKLTVEDDGTGMNEQTIKQIFDPFFTTKFTGRGLGLAAVLGIVRGHKGALRVESQPYQGTKFEIVFPASNKPIQEKPLMNTTSHPNPRKIVLVIDDEEPVREVVSDILGMEGVDVLQAADGQEGIGVYQSHMAEIDLVLLDLSMPGLSGEDTLKELHQIDPQVRVLLSSGYSESEVTYGLEQSGLVGFLQKPYRMDTLLEEVSRHLNYT